MDTATNERSSRVSSGFTPRYQGVLAGVLGALVSLSIPGIWQQVVDQSIERDALNPLWTIVGLLAWPTVLAVTAITAVVTRAYSRLERTPWTEVACNSAGGAATVYIAVALAAVVQHAVGQIFTWL